MFPLIIIIIIIIAFLIRHLEATGICEISNLPAKYRGALHQSGKSCSEREVLEKPPVLRELFKVLSSLLVFSLG